MRLGIRLLFAFFLINGIAAFFVLRVFTAEIKPSVREVMEDMLVDTANILAELASDDLAMGRMNDGRFAQQVRQYASRPINAAIWGFSKQSLDYRIYVTDARGTVVFDSENRSLGEDYSQWRDVARTLRGDYGARATRQVQADDTSGVMYVAAPVVADGRVVGVLTVAKPVSTVQRFIDRAENKVLASGLLLLVLSAAVGVAVTLWMVWNVRRLRDYALSVQGPADGEHDAAPVAALAVPRVPGELGDLARAMDRMRARLEGRDYIEGYVRALTHELKSPVAAIRGAGELLQDDLPAADRAQFATQVVQQLVADVA
jgi:two-component system sensor histidine kinase CreC